MIVVDLIKSNGEILKLRIPEEAKECKYRLAVDFEFANLELIEWIKENHETFFNKKRQYVLFLIKCIGKFCDINFSDFLEIDSGYLSEITDNDLYDHFEKLNTFKFAKGTRITDLHDALLQIYSLIINVLSNSKGVLHEYGSEKFEYTYFSSEKEQEEIQTFYIPTIWKDEFMNAKGFISLSVKQLTEILDLRELYYNNIESKPDTFGSYIFSKVIGECALMLLKKDNDGNFEKIPIKKDEYQKWFMERCRLFYDIDLQTALDLQFWFDSYWHWLENDEYNWYFFNSKEPLDEYEMKAREKMKAVNSEIFQRIRWKGMINRLLSIGAWKADGVSNMEAVLNASATESIGLISAENSTT